MPGLNNGDLFPPIEFALVGGGTFHLPTDLAGRYGVVLVYRASWCGFCNAQLASFAAALPRLTEAGIAVVAFSVDDEAPAAETVERHASGFPVGYGVDLEATAAALQCYVNHERGVLEATNVLLTPEGRIDVVTYSSKTIGRFVPDDVLTYVERQRQRIRPPIRC